MPVGLILFALEIDAEIKTNRMDRRLLMSCAGPQAALAFILEFRVLCIYQRSAECESGTIYSLRIRL